MTLVSGPPPAVLMAFGLEGPAVRLRGGQGTSWRVGDAVLKPRVDPQFQEWLGTEVATIEQHGFRRPAVRRAVGGAWAVDGWGAQSAMTGSTIVDGAGVDWRAVITVSRALHAATASLARPAFLDRRTDPWAVADRDAWGEVPRMVAPELREVVERLTPALSLLGPAQLVHGDLTNNMLLDRGEPPSIIDFSPYWRPPSYAEGIVITDALCWHDARPELVHEADVPIAAVARGLLFRLLTASRIHWHQSPDLLDEAHRYRSATTALNL